MCAFDQLTGNLALDPNQATVHTVDTIFLRRDKPWYFPLGALAEGRAKGTTQELFQKTFDELRTALFELVESEPRGETRATPEEHAPTQQPTEQISEIYFNFFLCVDVAYSILKEY